MRRYNPREIEPKWQAVWDKTKLYEAKENSKLPKHYQLEFFPYPSAATMHVGHVRNYAISDTQARYMRMRGHNVLHPMGWDAFGLPAENYAIKQGVSPRKSNEENIKVFKRQLSQLGFSYDWTREIDSSKPDYYKWTQWLFLQFYKKGLAYRAKSFQNWCPTDKTVLANEQVINQNGVNVCERDGTPVVQKEIEQWFLKITDYADRLIDDLADLDWPESIKTMQRNWIGRSRGVLISFAVASSKDNIEVFTTRPDTIYGATYMVLAPEHPMVNKLKAKSGKLKVEIEEYVKASANKTELDRKEGEKDKTGIFIGAYALNPATKEKIPIWIADYVLMGYGTGAIMAVPAHDERDFEFAKKYKLPIKKIIESNKLPYEDEGLMVASGKYDSLDSAMARERIIVDLVKTGVAAEKTQYKLRDWSVSRQRYWGAPIPIVYCDKDGIVPVPEKDLPVILPENVKYEPTGQSPLKKLAAFVNTTCPKCGDPAKRETDTFDTFVDSSWYYLRFTDPHDKKALFDEGKVNYWMPVDSYIGGAEHAVVHLLYARFWTKFLYDQKLVGVNEPFKSLHNQGMIGGADGRKMGKRYGNVVTPDKLIDQGYGADALRLYELFIAPFDQDVPWNPSGVVGTRRFLDRLWTLIQEYLDEAKSQKPKAKSSHDSELEVQIARAVHKAIKKVSQDLEVLGFNTAIAALMETVNELYKIKADKGISKEAPWKGALETLTQLLAPFAPHIAEELWAELGHKESVHVSKWPAWDEKLVKEDQITLAVQVNGKVRAEISVAADIDEAGAIEAAKAEPKIAELLKGAEVQKAIYVPGRLVSLVIK